MLRWMKKNFTRKSDREPSAPAIGIDVPQGRFDVIYAVGDIHGRLDLLLESDRKIEADIAENERALVIYLGDYIDRGPDSRGVIEHLQSHGDLKFMRLCLRGNHDDVFLSFLEKPLAEWGWLDLGGRETLRSYGIALDPYRDRALGHQALVEMLNAHVPATHRQFFSKTRLWARSGDFLFVHAGIQPGMAIERQEPRDFMWIREPFLSEGSGLPLTVVHGHTPGAVVSYGPNRIGIDTGAYATGRLTVLKIADGITSEL
ncbi:serine/threonine protein phosphatase 1 [Ensifer adhaerens]|nr:serine/threonine protein phosphatase 1 [Ensifer adhaerens]